MRNVLFYFPHNPYPPATGAHRRCLQLLSGLRSLGCRVVLASSAYAPGRAWSDESAEGLSREYGCSVRVFRPGRSAGSILRLVDVARRHIFHRPEEIQLVINALMRRWLTRVGEEVGPDVLFMNYAYTDAFLPPELRAVPLRIMEMHDLVSLNSKMQNALTSIGGVDAFLDGRLPDELLDLAFYDQRSFVPDQYEFDVYDSYRYTTCISSEEQSIVATRCAKTRAVHVPMTYSVAASKTSYDGDALFAFGHNPFNTQGYYLLCRKVLPRVLRSAPSFRLRTTGRLFGDREPLPYQSVVYEGFVTDLTPWYDGAGFFVCPVFGGTGQQVKIIEAMAHGLPVVAFRSAAVRSPLRHGENGLIADTVEEYAEHLVRLWKDRDLCRRFGEQARTTIRLEYSEDKLLSTLDPLVQ